MDLRSLNILSARLSRIADNINSGGCCIVAGAVATHLSKHTPIKIRVLNNRTAGRPGSIIKARPKVGNNCVEVWNDLGVHFGHVVIELKIDGVTHYWDSDGLSTEIGPNYRHWKMHSGWLNIKETIELGDDTSGWNHMFRRSNVPVLKDAIAQFFHYSINQSYEQLCKAEEKLQELHSTSY